MPLTVAQLVARLTADTSGFYRGMALANSSMLRTGGIVTRVAAGAGLAVAGMGILSLRAAGNFEQSMNILGAVSGATTKQMSDMRKEAVSLGADLKLPNVSAKDAAQAMQELAKGGLSVNQIMGATRGTLQLGLAANMGFADSATVVARSLKAFGLEGKQATTVADLFTAAANKSTADMTDVALGFQQASAQFAAGDQTIQGLTTSLALMANAGIVGSDAGTSLKTMMNRLMAPTKKAADQMKDLGIQVYDSAGNMKPMPALIGEFNGAMSGMSKEAKNAALYTIFGSDAIRAARVQMNAGTDGWLKMEKAITKGGEAQAFAEARTKGFNGALQAFGSAVETLAIVLGTALLPAATSAVTGLTHLMMAIDPAKIIAFFGAIRDGVVFIVNFVRETDAAQYIVAALVGALAGLLIFSTITSLIGAMTAALTAMGIAMMANPIGIIVVALAALAAALVLAYMKSEQFREIVDRVFAYLKTAVPQAIAAITNFLRAQWASWGPLVTNAVNNVKTAIITTFNAIRGFIQQHGEQIKAVLKAVWNIITILIGTQIKIIANIIKAMLAVLAGDWGAAWNALKASAGAALRGAAAVIKAVLTQLVPAVLSLALSIGKAIIMGILRGLASLASSVGGKLRSAVAGAISGVVGWASGAAAAIGSAITSGILGGVGDLAGALASKLTSAVSGAIGAAKGLIHAKSPSKLTANEIGKPIADGILMGFLNGSADLPEKMSATIKKAIEAMKTTIEAQRSSLSSAWGRLAGDAMSAFDAITQKHQTPTEKILAEMERKDTLDRLTKAVSDAKAEMDRLAESGGIDTKALGEAKKDVTEAEEALKKFTTAPTTTEMRKLELAAEEASLKVEKLQAKLEVAAEGGKVSTSRMTSATTRVENATISLATAERKLNEERAKGASASESRIKDLEATVAKARNSLRAAQAGLTGLKEAAAEPADPLAISQIQIDLDQAKIAADEAQAAFSNALVPDPTKVAELTQAVADAQTKVQQIQSDGAAALLAATDAYHTAVKEKEKFFLEERAAKERLEYEARRALQKRHLEEQLAVLEKNLAKQPARHAFWQKKIIALLRRHGVTYKSAGEALGKAFATGMRESMTDVESVARSLARMIAKYLKLSSPAEIGPLSDLDKWWKAFTPTLVKGLDTAPVTTGAEAIANAARVGPPAVGTGGGGVVNNHFSFPNYVGDKRELMEAIRSSYAQMARANPGPIFSTRKAPQY